MKLTTNGYDVAQRQYVEANLRLSKDLVCLSLGNDELFRIPKSAWKVACQAVLSSVARVWVDSLNNLSDRTRIVDFTVFKKTQQLQTFVSLVHLASELELFPSKGGKTRIGDLAGRVLIDRGQAKNTLFVLPKLLQEKLKSDSTSAAKIMELGLLFELQSGVAEKIYFRPYNTPVVMQGQIDQKMKILMSEMKRHYSQSDGD